KWIYLEPIFGRDALPSEASRFARVDNEFRAILNDVARDARLVSLCNRSGLKNTLETIVDQLNRCQRALNQFLEDKRSAFSRFYFLGDDDLLEILGQSTNPAVIQQHLKKLFQGINRVIFSPDSTSITAMVSAHGETVNLSKPIRIVPQVEIWLQHLSEEMQETLSRLVLDAVRDANMDSNKYPSQVLCLAEEIRFSKDVEQALHSQQLPKLRTALESQLDSYTSSNLTDTVLQLKLKALILDLIHRIDVVDQLTADKTKSTSSWMWQKQLRYYIERERVVVRMVNSAFPYSYEYQGNAAKLVHTPLTDKCFLTLTQAMTLGLGGNPYGPAGTGKTESVKALAAALGRQVLVFNCDEGIDLQSLNRIFVGLVQCGAWGCFDEFNRLDATVLSAVSSKVQIIQDAIKNKLPTCDLGNKTVQVNSNSAIFITLNPAGKGYGGRQKLPDNLKQLFRPVVMSAPDNELIAETELFSDGFKQAKSLAKKIVTLFTLSKEMLSAQQHYDWGLRALKTVLRSCGDLRRKSPEESERNIVVKALLLNTLSKLTSSDSTRFNDLIVDIYSEVNKEGSSFEHFLEPLKAAAEHSSLVLDDKKLQKVFELYEQLRQRMGVVIVGPAGCGKSTTWQLLQAAMVATGEKLVVIHFNPKSMSRTRLLGHMDLDTREWSDGVITSAARQVTNDPSTHTWIICDGDVDPEWIEALNSVLDDNRLLTMPSGERIQFGTNVNFVFETDNLQFASPATISRMGMIFISKEDLSPADVLTKMVKELTKSEENNNQSDSWAKEITDRCLPWLAKKVDPQLKISTSGCVSCSLGLTKTARTRNEFCLLLYKGLHPLVAADCRRELAAQIFQGQSLPGDPFLLYSDASSDSFLQYFDDAGFAIKLDSMQYDRRRPFVLTANAQANRDVVASWLRGNNRQPFIVIGPDGCGKESLIRLALEVDSSSEVAIVHCNAQSSAGSVHEALHAHCVLVSSAKGRVFRPKNKDNLVLYLKGMNLPTPDKYGTSEMLAMVHQLLTYEGFYDPHFEWIGIENVQIIGSMSVGVDTSANSLPTRVLSLFRICLMDPPTNEDLNLISSAFLTPILESSLNSPQRTTMIGSMMVNIFSQVKTTFKSTEYPHYVFTPKDLTKWIVSLMRYELTSDPEFVQKVLIYESQRIFGDRLVSIDDKHRFDNILMEEARAGSKKDDSVFASQSLAVHTKDSVGIPLVSIQSADYESTLKKVVNRYEFEVANFKLPLLKEIQAFAAKVDRVLTTPGGSLLLAGRSGMGRKDVVQLIANMHSMPIFSPKITPSYQQKQFDNDIKTAIQTAITNSEHVVFIIEEYQLTLSSFLQSINCLLSSGEVPKLFTQQELDGMATQLREQSSEESFDGDLHDYFAYRTRSLLHIVIIMNTDKSDFSFQLLTNPALYKECTVIWRDEWSDDSLQMLPSQLLPSSGDSEQVANSVPPFFKAAPEQVPSKYVSFIETYAKIHEKNKKELKGRVERLKNGVSKLTAARETVAKMQKKAAKKSKLLAEKQGEADAALSAITQSMSGATDQKMSMEELKATTEKENVKIEEQKKIIDEQLSEVEPMLAEAREAVGSIKSESLSEIRSLRAPPEAVRDILQAVLLFMGILDTSWEAMRKFLAKSGVKDDIINFDAHRITSDVHKKVTQLVKQKAGSFDPKNAKRASAAAAPLAAWVMANLQYSTILEKIAPLEKVRTDLEKNRHKAEKQMEKISQGLVTVDQQVAELKRNFEVLMKEATTIKVDLEKEQDVIKVAGTLVERLGGEFERWNQQIVILEKELNQLGRFALLSAAFVTFLGNTSERVRHSSMEVWRTLCGVEDFDFLHFCAPETDLLKWKGNGLPSDNLSVENAVILFNCIDTPLVVDPTGRISKFLSSLNPNASSLNAAQSDLSIQIELGVRFGKTLIIEDVNEIEGWLVPLLRREISTQGPRKIVRIGDKQVDLHDDFRLFLCSRNENIQIPPQVHSSITEIKFTTTRSGLTSQLLGLALEMERPELEHRSSELLRQTELAKLELNELEQILLQELANSQGDLLENTSLLESLNKSKENAERIANSIEENEKLRKSLNTERDVFVPIAKFASSLYFAISDLHTFNKMYSFNISTIIGIYRRVFSNCKDRESSRLETLRKSLNSTTFNIVSRSLFKEDRLMFSLNYVRAIQPNLFGEKEYEFFCGNLLDGEGGAAAGVSVSWLDEESRLAAAKLQRSLPTLYRSLQLDDQGTWSEYAKSIDAEKQVPRQIEQKITPFQKVLAVQATRPDRTYPAVSNFTLKGLGFESLNPPPFNMVDIYQESVATQPIIILTVAGADPSKEVEEAARKASCAFESISLGQGQENSMVEALRRAAEHGSWLLLNNVHIMLASLPLIQKELATITPKADFRLWMTTEADDRFPSIILQEALKITFESPPGIKNNMINSYSQLGDSSSHSILTAQTTFVAVWLHALMQERRSFIPQAWTRYYEFSTADVRMAKAIVELMTQSEAVDWAFIRGLYEFTIYGGRLENDFDSAILRSYLKRLFNSSRIIGRQGQEVASGIGIIPATKTEDFVSHIVRVLPSGEDKPESFGLPANIRMAWMRSEAERTITSLRMLDSGSSQSSSSQSSQWASVLNPLLSHWKRLLTGTDLHTRNPEVHPKSGAEPLAQVLALEFGFSVSVLQLLHQQLTLINRIVKGVIKADKKMEEVLNSLILHQTPDDWQIIWSGPRDPSEYLSTIVYRTKCTQDLYQAADSNQLLQKPVNLAKLLRPKTLLTALRQMTARKQKVEMDTLQLRCSWEASKAPGAIALTVNGLQLQGALFEGSYGSQLKWTNESSPSFTPAPSLILAWSSDPSVYGEDSSVAVPIYSNSDRSELIATVQMPTDDPDKFSIAAVALFIK
ncbi:hypothetical protein PMAYCL1PPCAC_24416, partial [Pristionchus mayeri]